MRKLVSLAIGALMLGFAGVAQANLIQNGGFETGDLSDWTVTGNTGFIGVATTGFAGYTPHSGNYFAYLGAVGSLGFLSQTVTDIAGATYQISFWLASNGATPSEFDIEWNGVSLYDKANLSAFAYTEFTFDVTGNGADTLTFSERNDPSFFALDDVGLNPVSAVPAPEPASIAILTSALAGFRLIRRRRRRSAGGVL